MRPGTSEFIQMMKHPLKFRMFLFSRLPAAFFSGVRLRQVNENSCSVSVPYKWFSQNPFRSTYFACLAMAAEMTTGILGMMHIHKRQPAISMLVVKLESVYFKKATGITVFTCNDGAALESTIAKAIETGEAQTFTAASTGLNDAQEKIADFFVTWSFKARQS